jgi:DNA repair protein RadA/Sms
LNITGGISVDDPAIDLAVVAAILSSNEDIQQDFALLASRTVWRDSSVNRVNQRIQEAEKLGFYNICFNITKLRSKHWY